MKYLKFIFLLVAGLTISCEDDSTLGVSKVTTYPTITVTGESVVFVATGSSYTDAGASAFAGETEITPEVSTSAGVYHGAAFSTANPDKYVVSYSAENSDGFSGSALREIWVATTGDLTTSIEGLYSMSTERVGRTTETGNYVLITKTGANTYELTHGVGGWYSLGLRYGPNYAARGAIITATDIATNNFSVSDAQFPVWGNMVVVTDFMVDAGTKTVTYTGTGDWGAVFKATLTQVQL
jgi:hypothetical protein